MDLTEAILRRDMQLVEQCLLQLDEINYLDEYGYTPLIQSVIADEIEIATLLLEHGADPNQKDTTGGTPLHWAIYNDNLELTKLLLSHQANPNAYNISSEPVTSKAILRNNIPLKKALYAAGASAQFANDYIKVKLLGHRYELTGSVDIVDTEGVFTEVDYEGFYLESSVDLIRYSLIEFQNNFAARALQDWFGVIELVVNCLEAGLQLLKRDHYLTEHSKQVEAIEAFLKHDSFILPLNQQGHALSLVKHGQLIAIVDRAKDSLPNDRIPVYFLNRPAQLNAELLFALVFERQSVKTIHNALKKRLALQEIDSLAITDQQMGNCSWANIEAAVPVIKLMMNYDARNNEEQKQLLHTDCLELLQRWQQWGRERTLNSVIREFKSASAARRACMAALFAGIIFQRCHADRDQDFELASRMLPYLLKKEYSYIIDSYKQFYVYNQPTEAGANFLEMIERYQRELG